MPIETNATPGRRGKGRGKGRGRRGKNQTAATAKRSYVKHGKMSGGGTGNRNLILQTIADNCAQNRMLAQLL